MKIIDEICEIKVTDKDLIICESEILLPPEKLKEVRESLLMQAKEGVIVCPKGINCVVIRR